MVKLVEEAIEIFKKKLKKTWKISFLARGADAKWELAPHDEFAISGMKEVLSLSDDEYKNLLEETRVAAMRELPDLSNPDERRKFIVEIMKDS